MFAVYPNPASESLTLDRNNQLSIESGYTDSDLTSNIFYRLHDFSSGSVVLEGNSSSKNKLEIDVTKLNKGKYILKIRFDKDQEETHQIIIE